jgi:hypothetical protein
LKRSWLRELTVQNPVRPSGWPTDIEHEWNTLKAHRFARRTFKNVDDLKTAIDEEIKAMNQNRKPRSLAKQRISA